MKEIKYGRIFLIVTIVILIIWSTTIFLIYKLIPSDSIDNYGGIFGGINSLFSGIAVIGVVYSILIQQREIENAKFEFRFNRHNTILFSQSDFFNNAIGKYRFKKKGTKVNESIDFDSATEYFNEIKTNESELNEFLNTNQLKIIEVVSFIQDSFEFYESVLNKENFSPEEKTMLKRIFSRSLNNNLVDFIQIPAALINLNNKQKEKNDNDIVKEAEKLSRQILRIRTAQIIKFLDYKKE